MGLLALSVAVPAAAVSVDSKEVPGEAEAGTEMSASVELSELFTDNDEWRVNATTELVNKPKWTLELVDDGEVVETKTRVGQNVTFGDATVASPVDRIRLSVEGETPAVGNWSYENRPSFAAMSVAQVPVTSDGSTGAASTIETYETFHYTADSKAARSAIGAAATAISSAAEADADVSDANDALDNAKAFYRNSDFEQSMKSAEQAEQSADEARQSKQSSQQTQQLLIYAGVGVVVLALVAGGFFWYRQNQQDTSRLG